MKKLYFAYGSNMDRKRLESRVGPVDQIAAYQLWGWRLTFNAGGRGSGMAFANLVFATPNDYVNGVIYALSPKQLKMLDTFEGHPMFYTRMIQPYKGRDMHMYVSINPAYTQQEVLGVRPTQEYLGFMINGAANNGFSHLLKTCNAMLSRAPKRGALA